MFIIVQKYNEGVAKMMQEGQEGSEVARVLQRIQQEYEAAEQGLSGLACGAAKHQFINAKMERLHEAHEQLEALLGQEEATALIARTIWKPDEIRKAPG
jgi:hypothetical protein